MRMLRLETSTCRTTVLSVSALSVRSLWSYLLSIAETFSNSSMMPTKHCRASLRISCLTTKTRQQTHVKSNKSICVWGRSASQVNLRPNTKDVVKQGHAPVKNRPAIGQQLTPHNNRSAGNLGNINESGANDPLLIYERFFTPFMMTMQKNSGILLGLRQSQLSTAT